METVKRKWQQLMQVCRSTTIQTGWVQARDSKETLAAFNAGVYVMSMKFQTECVQAGESREAVVTVDADSYVNDNSN